MMNVYGAIALGILIVLFSGCFAVGLSPQGGRLAAWVGMCAGCAIGGLSLGILVRLVAEMLKGAL